MRALPAMRLMVPASKCVRGAPQRMAACCSRPGNYSGVPGRCRRGWRRCRAGGWRIPTLPLVERISYHSLPGLMIHSFGEKELMKAGEEFLPSSSPYQYTCCNDAALSSRISLFLDFIGWKVYPSTLVRSILLVLSAERKMDFNKLDRFPGCCCSAQAFFRSRSHTRMVFAIPGSLMLLYESAIHGVFRVPGIVEVGDEAPHQRFGRLFGQ